MPEEATASKAPITGETLESLKARLAAAGFPSFRAQQVMHWIYRRRVRSWEAMDNLPKAMRAWLDANFVLMPSERLLVKQAGDVTEKLLLKQHDGALIETVLIRYPQRGVGQQESRYSVCISTQVGCAFGCRFCASGLDGWKRNLSAGEIVAELLQVCWLEDDRHPEARTEQAPFDNMVVMGMGEPLANYDNLMLALRIVNADWGLKFGARRITVSTSGVVPGILRLADEPLQFRLALSLHGATDEVRQQIMPVNRRWPLAELLPAVKHFSEVHGRMLTLEFILIDEVNDTIEQARELARIARDLHAHVNLIPYNRVEGLPWRRPNIMRQTAFHNVLKDAGVSCTIRKEKGDDIDAACGQLRLRTEKRLGAGADTPHQPSPGNPPPTNP